MDREDWYAAIHGVAKSQTQLNWTELNGMPNGHLKLHKHKTKLQIFPLNRSHFSLWERKESVSHSVMSDSLQPHEL